MATTLKAIDAAIKWIATTASAVEQKVHETAVMIMEHAKEHGDCSRAQNLVMALPASFRRTTLIQWFTKYSPIVTKNSDNWNAALQPKTLASGKANPLYVPFNIEGAKAEPFYDIARSNPEREYSFDDIVKQVESLTKRIEREINENKVKPEDLESAKRVLATMESLHFTKVRATTGSGENDNELADLRKQYTDTFNKRPYHAWTADELRQKLADEASTKAEEGERRAA